MNKGVMLGGWVGPIFAGTMEIYIGVAFFSVLGVDAFCSFLMPVWRGALGPSWSFSFLLVAARGLK